MNYNDNDIKKSIEWHLNSETNCGECSYNDFKKTNGNCVGKMLKDALDLINRQQAEIEKFTKRQKPTGASGYKIVNGKVVFFTNMLGGCRHEYENLDEVVKTLNELLQECYSKDEIAFALKCKTEDLKTAKTEAIKEFAERLKATFPKREDSRCTLDDCYTLDCIDNLVKEMTESGRRA